MKQLSILAVLGLLSCGPVTAAELALKPTIVLVHGAFETADVWGQVAAGLRHDGFKVIAVDLPGRPGNALPTDLVSLVGYQRAVAAVIADERRPIVLVGHSFGASSSLRRPKPSRAKSGRSSMSPPTCPRTASLC